MEPSRTFLKRSGFAVDHSHLPYSLLGMFPSLDLLRRPLVVSPSISVSRNDQALLTAQAILLAVITRPFSHDSLVSGRRGQSEVSLLPGIDLGTTVVERAR